MKWFGGKPHKHYAYRWDGYYESCKCGVSAGDLRSPSGIRYAFFSDWPKDYVNGSI